VHCIDNFDDLFPKPDWNTWKLIPKAQLWMVVALSCDIEPDTEIPLKEEAWEDQLRVDLKEYRRRLKIAKAHLDEKSLISGVTESEQGVTVKLCDFAEWAGRLKLSLPEEFPRDPLPVRSDKWPWGDHQTKLLGDLAKAGLRWWQNYDPDENDTAPTNKQVAKWLEEKCHVSRRISESMASILRADGLPTGPRSKNTRTPK